MNIIKQIFEIYQRFKGPLHAHACRKIRHEAEANDLVHDLFAAVWDRRETLKLTGPLSFYLYTSLTGSLSSSLKKGASA